MHDVYLSPKYFKALADFLVTPSVIFVTLMTYAIVFALSLYAMIYLLPQGLERKHLALDQSPVVKFYSQEDELFRRNPYRIQIVFHGRIQYWNESIRRKIYSRLDRFKESGFIDENPDFEENWLKEFLDYAG